MSPIYPLNTSSDLARWDVCWTGALELADALEEVLQPRALLVICKARQMCMEMTGATSHGNTIAMAARGEWKEQGWEMSRLLVAL